MVCLVIDGFVIFAFVQSAFLHEETVGIGKERFVIFKVGLNMHCIFSVGFGADVVFSEDFDAFFWTPRD